jgi:hypothetical protein
MDGTAEVVRRRAEAQVPDKKDISLLLSRLSLIVMSVHRHCAWLKPETAAKIEQLANASGQSDTKRRRICASQAGARAVPVVPGARDARGSRDGWC